MAKRVLCMVCMQVVLFRMKQVPRHLVLGSQEEAKVESGVALPSAKYEGA